MNMFEDDEVIIDDAEIVKDHVSEAESSEPDVNDLSQEAQDKIWVWRKNLKQYYNVIVAENIANEPQFGATSAMSFRGTVQSRANRDDPHAVSALSLYAGTTHLLPPRSSSASPPASPAAAVDTPQENVLVLYDDLRLPAKADGGTMGLELKDGALTYGDFGAGPVVGLDVTAGRQFRRARWLTMSGPTLNLRACPYSLNLVAARVGASTRTDSGSVLYHSGGGVVIDISQHSSQPVTGAGFKCEYSLQSPFVDSAGIRLISNGADGVGGGKPLRGVGAGLAWNEEKNGVLACTYASAPGAVCVYDLSCEKGSGAVGVGASTGRADRARPVFASSFWGAPEGVCSHHGSVQMRGEGSGLKDGAGEDGGGASASGGCGLKLTGPAARGVGLPAGCMFTDGVPCMYADVVRECAWTSATTLLVGCADRFAFYDTRLPSASASGGGKAAVVGVAGAGGPLVSVCPTVQHLFATTVSSRKDVVALYDARNPQKAVVDLTRGGGGGGVPSKGSLSKRGGGYVSALSWHPTVPHLIGTGYTDGEVVLFDASQRAAVKVPEVDALFEENASANVEKPSPLPQAPSAAVDDEGAEGGASASGGRGRGIVENGAVSPEVAAAAPVSSTGRRVAFVHHGHTECVSAVSWFPDSDGVVASATVDGDLHVFRPADVFLSRAPLEGLPEAILSAAERALAGSRDAADGGEGGGCEGGGAKGLCDSATGLLAAAAAKDLGAQLRSLTKGGDVAMDGNAAQLDLLGRAFERVGACAVGACA